MKDFWSQEIDLTEAAIWWGVALLAGVFVGTVLHYLFG